MDNDTTTSPLGAKLPYRFREEAFRRYEKIIATAVAVFPNAVSFRPAEYGLASTTFACRLRDAIRSLRVNRWNTNEVDTIKLDMVHKELIISEQNGTVVTGDAKSVRSSAAHVLSPTQPPQDVNPFDLIDLTKEQLTLVAILAHNRMFNRPIRVANAPMDVVDELRACYDVSIETDETGSITIL